MSGRSKTDVAETQVGERSADETLDHVSQSAPPISGALPRDPRGRALLPGNTLVAGRLSITGRIGEGGMGMVYEAFDRERDARVALKTLNHLDAASVYQLKNEFRMLADVVHPNLVALHELFAEGDTWFFTMDLVDGVGFDAWVRPPPARAAADSAARAPLVLDQSRLRAALAQLLAAVRAIHAAGKVHRDLKPANVLVTKQGTVVVLDFGLAADPRPGGIGHTARDLSVSGTPAYMAPEQAAGDTATTASDMYAIGVMLFEALTARLPFEGRMFEMLVDKQRLNAPAVHDFAPEAPADLAQLCDQLLAREPRARPDAAAIWELLRDQALDEAPVSAPVRPSLLGREAELAALQAAFESARDGRKPVVVLLSGESGIGKSALAEEFLTRVRAETSAVVLSGRCFERESVPFKGFDNVIDELSRHLRRLSNDQVSALLPRDAFALRRLFPVLGRLPAIAEVPERELQHAQELRRRAFDALAELLARMRDRRELIVHVDDLQWSDADSTLLLMHLLRQPDAPRLLFIASHRTEQVAEHPCLSPLYTELPLDVRLDVRVLRLGPLPEGATRALLAQRLARVSPRLLAEAGGNPFLLHELARHAAEQNGATPSEFSLRQLVSARIAELAEPERRLIEILAVSSRPLALTLAAQAVQPSEANTTPRALFERLRRAHLARSTGERARIECFHDKVREALLQTLSGERMREHHAALARALFASHDPDPEQLAEHLLGAGEPARAAEQWERAAERARRELGFERAARLYALALEYGRFDAARTHQLRLARGDALAEAGRGLEAADAYEAAWLGADPAERLHLQQRAAEQLVYGGQLERGRALFAAVFRELGMHMPGNTARIVASIAYHQARLALRRQRWSGAQHVDAQTRLRLDALWRASNALSRVDLPRGIELGLRLSHLALQRGDARDAALGLCRLIHYTAVLGGDAAAIARASTRAEVLAATCSDEEVRGTFWMFRGAAQTVALQPDYAAGIRDLRRCLELSEGHAAPGLSYHRSLCQWLLAMMRVTQGEAAAIAAELPARLDEAWSRHDLTLVPLWSGVTHALCSLAIGDSAGLRHHLARATAIWSLPEYSIQEMSLRDAQWRLDVYDGRLREAWQCTEQYHARLLRSSMRRSVFRSAAQNNRGLCAAALVAQLPPGSERSALLAHVAEIAREPDQALVRAAVACRRGDAQAAIAALRAAPARNWEVENIALRRRLGVLVGGEEGHALIAEADARFRAGGVVDPEHYSAVLLPGLELG